MAKVTDPRDAVRVRRQAKRADRANPTIPDVDPDEVDEVEVTPTRVGGRRLKAEELGVGENSGTVILGMDPTGRRRITWDMENAGSLLAVGYGVPHLSYLNQTLMAHFSTHGVPIHGIDYLDLLSGYKTGTFTTLIKQRRPEAIDLLERLQNPTGEQALILTQAGSFINPVNSNMSAAAQASSRNDIINLLVQLVNDDKTHVIVETSKFKTEADMPQVLIDAFSDRLVAGRIFSNESPRVINDAQKALVDKMSIYHSLLAVPAGDVVLQHARSGLLRHY